MRIDPVSSTGQSFLIFLGLVFVVVFAVVGCNESSDKEITHYINQIKMRKATPIKPIASFLPPQSFIYPKDGSRRSPFSPVVYGQDDEELASLHIKHKSLLKSSLIQINYAKANDIAALIKDKNNSLLSKRGSLSVDVRTNTLLIHDKMSIISQIRAVVKQLDIPVRQVQIEARIVNVTKEAILDLGIRFGVSKPAQLSGTSTGAKQLVQGVVSIVDRLNVDFGAPVESPASIGIALAKLGNGILLDLELSALESEDKAEIIANPRLVATNQHAAVIESGEEIPYQEATLSGATAVAFKKAVLSLKVTPQITPDNCLLLDLEINQDTPSGRLVNGVPAINTNRIHTSVLVNNGQTLVLGGIYKQEKNNTIKRVPFLGNLPVIGALFRNLHRKVKNEELLIFITPRIITNNLSIITH